MRHRAIVYCIVIMVIFCRSYVSAQSFIVKGLILKDKASERISGVQIVSQKTRDIAVSNYLGNFSIKTSMGDTLQFNKTGYLSEKMVVVNSNDLLIYLKPVVLLNEVVIKDKTALLRQKEIVNSYRAKGLYFDGRPPLIIFNPLSGSPLTGFHELFGKDAADERRFIHFSQNEHQAEEIDKRYTKELVKNITHLPDEELLIFMDAYRPSYSNFKNWNDYQLYQYIQSSFEAWQEKNHKTGK